MYRHNSIGPWPIIDPSVSKVTDSGNGTKNSKASSLTVRLDTANLGTNTEAFANVVHTGATSSAAVGDSMAYGVALCPIENLERSDETVVLDISIAVAYLDVNGKQSVQAFVGFIDVAGAAIGNGWDADNDVTDYCIVGDGSAQQYYDAGFCCNTQVVLKDITSGGLDVDKFVVVGFYIWSSDAASSLGNCEYTISARYALGTIKTIDEDG